MHPKTFVAQGEQVLGRLAAVRLLQEAHALLLEQQSPASVRIGWMRLDTEMAAPAGPEPVAGDEDQALARRMELAVVSAA